MFSELFGGCVDHCRDNKESQPEPQYVNISVRPRPPPPYPVPFQRPPVYYPVRPYFPGFANMDPNAPRQPIPHLLKGQLMETRPPKASPNLNDPKYSKLQQLKAAIEGKKSQRDEEYVDRTQRVTEISEMLKAGDLDPNQVRELKGVQQELENDYLRARRKKGCLDDFETISVVGAGAFGAVRLVKSKQDNKVYALKQMPKSTMKNKNQRDRVLAERSVLANAVSTWIVSLEQTFQDDRNLYMLMEYLPGGDFMSHLIRLDSLDEEQTAFYMAELVLAVGTVHELGYVHRDIKPDNMVLNRDGHLKLLDFGLCKMNPKSESSNNPPKDMSVSPSRGDHRVIQETAMSHPTREMLRSQCGTPNYMAPEVFRRQGYDKAADWWSVGIIAYECLYGGVPFNDPSHDVSKIATKVVKWRNYLVLPHPRKRLSDKAVDLLKRFLCEPADRITFDEIKAHPFFSKINWDNIHDIEPPIKPQINDDCDTSNFDFDSTRFDKLPKAGKGYKKDLNYDGYTYNRAAEVKKPTIGALLDKAGAGGS